MILNEVEIGLFPLINTLRKRHFILFCLTIYNISFRRYWKLLICSIALKRLTSNGQPIRSIPNGEWNWFRQTTCSTIRSPFVIFEPINHDYFLYVSPLPQISMETRKYVKFDQSHNCLLLDSPYPQPLLLECHSVKTHVDFPLCTGTKLSQFTLPSTGRSFPRIFIYECKNFFVDLGPSHHGRISGSSNPSTPYS